MGGSSSKENERANDIARQERERAAQQAAALQAQQAQVDAQLRQRTQEAVAPTDIERMYQGQIGTLAPQQLASLQDLQAGGYSDNTPLGKALQDRLLSDLSVNPDDLFAPNLELLKGQVGQFAARRGIVGSGLELEQLGRTGVELAIQQAQARQTMRDQQVQQAISGNQSLEAVGAQRRGESTQYLTNLQSLEDTRRAREIGAVTGANQTGASLQSQGNLSALERLQQGGNNAFNIESAQLAQQNAARASQQAGIGKIAGTVVGAAAGIPFGPAGISTGAQIGGGLFGGQQASPLSLIQPSPVSTTKPGVSSLLAGQRQAPSGAKGGYLDPWADLVNSTWGRK